MLDALGERYGMLPSELLDRANTFDLWVYDVAVSWINAENDKANGKTPQYDESDLRKRMENVKNARRGQ
nr:MAG TPA: hypothetical protein [Caudoviricetes sp.]